MKLLKQLARNVDLGDVEETLDYIQNSRWVEGRKANFIDTQNDYM